MKEKDYFSMMKKIIILSVILSLSGCGQVITLLPSNRDFVERTETIPQTPHMTKTKTAMLLPLSGHTAVVGENFQNAALMAGLERTTETTEVSFYDTQGTPTGALQAYEDAIRQNPDVILGPVFASEVQVVQEQKPDIPVISFTSDATVLGDNVYSLALLIPQQVQRIVRYACMNGQRRFALIGPQDKTGSIVVQSFERAVQECPGMQLTHISLYEPQTNNLTAPVSRIAPPLIDSRRKDLTDEEKEILRHPTADRLSFDALFIFENGVKLDQLVSILYYYDVTPQIVPFYGLATLRHTQNDQLIGAYFADVPQYRLDVFRQKYKDAFGKEPLPIAAFGYDAVSLVSFLSQQNALNEYALTDQIGFHGMNGRFRLNENGTNERLLDIFQIQPRNHIITVDNALTGFE